MVVVVPTLVIEGVAPPTGPVYPMIVSLNPAYPQYAGDGGFCGGGGCGGHANSNGGRGGHGAVRIVYGYLGPGDAVPTNRREFPKVKMLTKVINMQSHWVEQLPRPI